jgi:hypothetical protein
MVIRNSTQGITENIARYADTSNSFICIYVQEVLVNDSSQEDPENRGELKILFETQKLYLKYHHFDRGLCHLQHNCDCTMPISTCGGTKKCSNSTMRSILLKNTGGTLVKDKDVLTAYLNIHLKYNHIRSNDNMYKARLVIYDGEWFLNKKRDHEEWCHLPPIFMKNDERIIDRNVFMDKECLYNNNIFDSVIDNLATIIWKFRQ